MKLRHIVGGLASIAGTAFLALLIEKEYPLDSTPKWVLASYALAFALLYLGIVYHRRWLRWLKMLRHTQNLTTLDIGPLEPSADILEIMPKAVALRGSNAGGAVSPLAGSFRYFPGVREVSIGVEVESFHDDDLELSIVIVGIEEWMHNLDKFRAVENANVPLKVVMFKLPAGRRTGCGGVLMVKPDRRYLYPWADPGNALIRRVGIYRITMDVLHDSRKLASLVLYFNFSGSALAETECPKSAAGRRTAK